MAGDVPRPRVPASTYRLQLTGAFTLHDVVATVDYLARLGVGALYLSPILTVPEGAAHGYHVTDPTTVNAELGGDDGLTAAGDAARAAGLGMVVDIVPNHLAAHEDNPWWADVLRRGQASEYARFFDIDWEAGGGKVVLPVLGAPLDAVAERGELWVDGDVLRYHDRWFPLAAGTGERDLGAALAEQHYQLGHWETTAPNYRRFFDITGLVGVRVEDPHVFAVRHERLRMALSSGVVTGVRVDHVDGLRDPAGYLSALHRLGEEATGHAAWTVVEKIVEGDEPLPGWPVDGTTGYEFLAAIQGLQVDAAGLASIDRVYRDRTGVLESPAEVLVARKREALERLFPAEVAALTRRLGRLGERLGSPVDAEAIRAALVAATVALPVYRTYVTGDPPQLSDRDAALVAGAAARAREGGADPAAVDLVERILSLHLPADLDPEARSDWVDTVVRWQQLTGPAMAKGFEDTTFYVHVRLSAQNEVGMDAHAIEHPGGIDGFHAVVHSRSRAWPAAMTTTSTHDTKRSEDVRARLNVLADLPARWNDAVTHWLEASEAGRTDVDGSRAPSANEQWLAFQTLVGMWPFDGDLREADVPSRLSAYLQKAAREAKTNTSWRAPNEPWEAATERWVRHVLDDPHLRADIAAFVEAIVLPGAVNSLAQATLKIAAPGVPDVYQGCEQWDLSLVDPDNRRPVAFGHLAATLEDLEARAESDVAALVADLRVNWRDGRIKQYTTWRGLTARRRHPDLFVHGTYEPLFGTGAHADRLVAFARAHDGRHAVALTATHCAGWSDGWPCGRVWEDTAVPLPARVTDVFTGRVHDAGSAAMNEILGDLPVALLVG